MIRVVGTVLLVGVVASASYVPLVPPSLPRLVGHSVDYYLPPRYAFHYGFHDVNSGSHQGHTESRDGDNTKGSYFVNLPDGRRQVVDYYVDEHGYHPTITYEGEPRYSDTHHTVHHVTGPHPAATTHYGTTVHHG